MKQINKILGSFLIMLFFISVCLNVVFIPKTNVFKLYANRIQSENKPVSDTVIITRTDTIWHTIEKEVLINKPTLISEDTTGTRVYIDTIRNQYVDIVSRVLVQGVFKANTFEYKLKFPEYRTIQNQLITQTKYKSGFYTVGSVSIAPGKIDLYTGFVFIPKTGRLIAGYQYGISNRGHLISFGYRF